MVIILSESGMFDLNRQVVFP